MMIKQLSVFLQNQLGRREELTGVLLEHDINISALSVAETAEYGVMRMIVSDTEKAEKVLREKDFSVKLTDVICIVAPDVPGSLHKTLALLAAEGINVSYMYGYSSEGKARLVLKVSDPTRAQAVIEKAGF